MAVRTTSAVPHGRPAPEVLVGPESLWDMHSALREPLARAALWPSRPALVLAELVLLPVAFAR